MRSVLRGIVLLLSLSGCANSDLVPTQLQSQISREISYGDIKADPERFKGRIVVVGGHVLSSKRLKDRTEIEVLQLPLDRRDQPVSNLMNSKGRFLAFSQTELNPSAVPPGSKVSMVAEVLGSHTATLDDRSYLHCTHPPRACPDRLSARSPTLHHQNLQGVAKTAPVRSPLSILG